MSEHVAIVVGAGGELGRATAEKLAVAGFATLAVRALAEPASADTLPDYAPIPPSALGPAVKAQGYFDAHVAVSVLPASPLATDRGADEPGERAGELGTVLWPVPFDRT